MQRKSSSVVDHIEAYDTIEDVTLTARRRRGQVGRPEAGEVAASGLKPEHLAVFDCAFKPARGTRSLHYTAHLKMMAPRSRSFLAPSPRPSTSPTESRWMRSKNVYIEAWRMGLKCVAIYRDGSKMSQPLNTAQKTVGRAENLKKINAKLQAELEALRALVGQPVRRRMPDTRTSITHKFDIAGHEGYFTVGLYDDGTPGEMFITMSKEGSTVGGLMDTIATLTSVALQYGVPLQDLVRKFAFQRFEPSGFTKNPQIRQATSLVDYIFRWMGINFVQGYADSNKGNGDGPPRPHDQAIAQRSGRDSCYGSNGCNRTSGAGVSAISESMAHFQMDAPFCSECGTRLQVRQLLSLP